MRNAIFIAVVFYLLLMPAALQAQNEDTVKIVSIQVDPDPVNPVKFGLPVNLVVTGNPGNMDDQISAASLGHYFDPGDYVTIDSVRLTGGLAWGNIAWNGSYHDDAQNLGVIGFVLMYPNYILPGESGLLGTLWFTLDANAPDHVIEIDSGYFPPAGDYILTNGNGVSIYPEFVAGTITVGTGISSELVVSPTALTFEATVGGTDPSPQSFNISNAQSGDMAWTATEDATWFGLSATSGSVPPAADVDVSVTISGLTADTYVDTILVEAPGATNSPQEVIVTLNLTEPPDLSVTPASLLFEGVEGGINNDVQNIYIENTGGGELNWTASNDSSWLDVVPPSGTGPATLDVSVDLAGLTAGTYLDSIEIAAEGAVNSPQFVEVTLDIAVPPEIVLDQVLFSYTMTYMDPQQTDDLGITNGGDGELNWTADNNYLWLSLDIVSGTAPSTVTFTVDPSGLALGTHYDTITVSCAEASNSPQLAEVVLEIQSPYLCCDVTDDQTVNVSDAVYITNYVFIGGGAPDPLESGDCTCDDNCNISDAVAIINFVFIGGYDPCDPNDDGIPDCGPGSGPGPGECTSVTDIDGNVYPAIQIGDQCWMMENLKVTHFRNGDPIPNVTDDIEWMELTAAAYCDYDNDDANSDVYGRLYNWYAIDDPRGLAPEGWHVPTDEEWKQLEMYLGMSQAEADATGWRGTDEGGKLKEAGTIHWYAPNTGATNESGFTALPAGMRHPFALFEGLFLYTTFWTSTEDSDFSAFIRQLYNNYEQVWRFLFDKKSGCSVRCVKD